MPTFFFLAFLCVVHGLQTGNAQKAIWKRIRQSLCYLLAYSLRLHALLHLLLYPCKYFCWFMHRSIFGTDCASNIQVWVSARKNSRIPTNWLPNLLLLVCRRTRQLRWGDLWKSRNGQYWGGTPLHTKHIQLCSEHHDGQLHRRRYFLCWITLVFIVRCRHVRSTKSKIVVASTVSLSALILAPDLLSSSPRHSSVTYMCCSLF